MDKRSLRRVRLAWLGAGFISLALGACGGGSGDGAAPAPAPAPVPSPPPSPPPPPLPPPLPPAWSAAGVLGDRPVPIDAAPQLAVNAAGEAVAVWPQRVDARASGAIVGSSYRAGRWSTPYVIRTSIGGATAPLVGIDDAGNAVVVWRDTDTDGQPGQAHAMWSARGTRRGDGTLVWTSGFKLPAGAEALDTYALAVAPDGRATLAWRELLPAAGDLPAQRNLVAAEGDGITWSAAVAVEATDGDVDHPVIAAGPGGTTVLAWQQAGDSGSPQVLASRRTGTSTWSLPQRLSEDGGRSAVLASAPRVAVAADGRSLVVWQQNEGPLRSLWSSAGTASGNWSTGVGITAPAEARQFNEPALAMNPAGRAVLAWGDATNSWSQVFVRGYDAATAAWGSEQQASTEALLQNTEQRVAVDANGRATVVWRGSAANPHVFARTLDAAGAWLGEPTRIDSPADDASYAPQVAVDNAGTLLSVWTQFSGSIGKIWQAVAP